MKFSIRDLLLVTVIVALAVGWWLDHRRQATRIEDQAVILEDWHCVLDEVFPPIPYGRRFGQPRGDY